MVKCQINYPTPNLTVMELDGRFDRNTAPQLRRDILKLAREKGAREIEINFSNAVCTDTCCIAVMVEILRAVLKQGGRLKISGIDDNTARMISLSQLDEIFKNVVVTDKK
ncbi:MAG: STAS domain-containing protein [Syntrophobacter sp.]